jgi:sulfate adenylyltransferase subunit 2
MRDSLLGAGSAMMHLDALESQSIYILREAFRSFDKLGMLWSVGKDSNALLWLVRKAFFGHVPFPVVHIDTSYKIPEMIEFRDRLAKEWGLNLIVGRNEEALAAGMEPTKGRVVCCTALKTDALKSTVETHGFTGVIAGIRRDEEGTRSKERVFSPRGHNAEWDYRDQPPEFWDQFKTEFAPGIDLYFAKNGKRYRSLGCAPCTGTIESSASTVEEIIAELESTRISERSGRAQDKEAEDAFERLRVDGYM